ncbi:ATP-binding protein [Flavobacterium sp. ANB]|nr:ATP-binding protein [Flavobacterium sp. ANB]MTD68510.1 ATP-binding protein [Flavobacterium sp. LC2016-13]
MSATQQIQGDYSGSETNATEAIPFFTKKTNSYYVVAIYNILGINYKNIFDFNNAILYYNLAYKFSEDDLQKSIIKNNIAVVYIDRGSYERALQILLPLENKQLADNPENNARVLDNIGFCYFKLKNPKAINYLNRSLQIRRDIKDSFGITSSLMHFSEIYAETNQKLAKHYADDAYKKATEVNNVDDRLLSLGLSIKNSNGDELKKTTILYLKINDSIVKARQKAKNKFAKIKYDSKKEKEENQKLRLEKAEHLLSLQEAKYQKIVGLIVFFFLGIVIVILIRYYRHKNRIVKIKTAYDTETRIAKDIHDELANDVFYAITFTQTQSLTSDNIKETLIQKLDHIYTRVRGISRENNNIDTGVNYAENMKEMLSTYNSKTTNVIINGIEKVNWDDIDEIKKVAVHRILQELMVNMKKHSDAQLVVLKFDSNSKSVFIDYADNGKGFEKEKISKNGLQNMENRIQAIKGSIIFDTEPDKGFKVKIKLPK